MKNTEIARVLKEYRKTNNLSVKDIVAFLDTHHITVAEKTIYGWENGASQPDADTLMLLCTIYQIDDVLGTFGYQHEKSMSITKYEENIIKKYREHPELHLAILKLLDITPVDNNYFTYKNTGNK